MSDFATLLGDGDGPAVRSVPAIHMARQVTGNIRVAREGELVVMQIGSTTLRLKYKDAMQIGQWLMQRAYEAKVLANDKMR